MLSTQRESSALRIEPLEKMSWREARAQIIVGDKVGNVLEWQFVVAAAVLKHEKLPLEVSACSSNEHPLFAILHYSSFEFRISIFD